MNWWPQTALRKSSYGLLKCEYINKSKLATKGPQVKVARMIGFQKVLEDQKIMYNDIENAIYRKYVSSNFSIYDLDGGENSHNQLLHLTL